MTTNRFIPFGLEDDDVEEFFALTEELSEATMQLLRNWVVRRYGGAGSVSGERVIEYASAARLNLDLSTRHRVTADNLKYFFPKTSDLLKFIQFLLFERSIEDYVIELDGILWRGHAAWTVTEWNFQTPARLTRRLPEGVAEAVSDVVSKSDLAGRHLKKAWNNAYEIDGDASVAYSSAIKAVETLACPLIEPKSAKSTLGTALAVLKNQHDSTKSTWEFTIENPKDAEESVNTVVSMMKLLWHGQTGRHGSDASVFKDATIAQAQAAVLLAATLVGWLNDGYLVKTK